MSSGAAGPRGRGAGTHPTFPVSGESADPLPQWHLWIDESPRPGWANMAFDLALLDRAEQHAEGWLRLYTWLPHCLSFGRHEPATRRYDRRRIKALGLDTVRRPTGGRAVWHARELTYAVAAPEERFGSLSRAYADIHQLLGEALRELGLEVTLASRVSVPGLGSGACFTRAVGGEVLVRGRKVIGSAQMRRGGALLQHGSILLHDDQSLVTRVEHDSCSGTMPDRLGGLTDPEGLQLQATAVAAAVTRAAVHHWKGDWEQVDNPSMVLREAAAHFPRFASSTWTWAR